MAYVFCIEIRQENDNLSEQLYSGIPYNLFNIQLVFRYVSSLNPETTLETFNQSVIFSRDMFLSQEFGPNLVAYMFANRGASLDVIQADIVPAILFSAWEIDNEPVNIGRKVIKLIVQVLVKVNTDNEIDQVIDESLNTLNFKPASSSSIQSLKRMKWGDEGHLPFKKRRRLLKGLSSNKECTICLDEFLKGDEVASMPCSHVYHEGCIVKWLETSHLCPLCRYQMPS